MAIIPVTWDADNKGTGVVLNNGNLTAVIPNYSNTVRASEGKTEGKWYWEISFSLFTDAMVGIVSNGAGVSRTYNIEGSRYYYGANGTKWSVTSSPYSTAYTLSDTIGVALDLDNGTLEFYKNGISQGIAFTDIKTLGEVFPSITSASSSGGNTSTANFGATPFMHPIPNGFLPYAWENAYKILLSSSDGKAKALVQNKYETPIMTSNTSPYGEAKSSSFHNIYHPWKAFDNSIGAFTSGWLSSGITNQWLSYTFAEKATISKYEIWSTGNRMPKVFRLEGSDDEINWIVLDEQDKTDWSSGDWNIFNIEKSKVSSFKTYRLFAVNNNGGTNYISIPEMRLFGSVEHTSDIPSTSEKHFIDYGVSPQDLASIDMSSEFAEKHYIQDQTTPLGEGRMFKHDLDMTKIINKVSVK